jgi:transposase-like protein
MAPSELTRNQEQWSGLLTEDKGLQEFVETGLNQGLEAPVTEQIGARPYERSPGRKTDRHGYRPRTRTTRVGPLGRHGPQGRDGRCSPALFARYHRSEQAWGLALRERGLQGGSTRQVAAVTEQLCGPRLSRSTVRPLCGALATRVQAWNERP